MEISRSVLVPFAAESLFDLIERAESYPQFLPWCTKATILERSDDWVAARIEFSYRQFSFGFSTRNPKRRPEWLHVRLVEGPFKHFHGDWRLTPLGDVGCKIDFDVSYEISHSVLDRLAGPAINLVAGSMMDAFVKRAEATLDRAPTPLESAPTLPESALAVPVIDVSAAVTAAPPAHSIDTP